MLTAILIWLGLISAPPVSVDMAAPQATQALTGDQGPPPVNQ